MNFEEFFTDAVELGISPDHRPAIVWIKGENFLGDGNRPDEANLPSGVTDGINDPGQAFPSLL